MQKGLGITALIIAIMSVIIPFYGPFLTVLSGILAAFSYGKGFALGIASLVLNIINIFFMSPSLWMTEYSFAMAREQGGSAPSFAIFILGTQFVSFVFLFFLNSRNKKKA